MSTATRLPIFGATSLGLLLLAIAGCATPAAEPSLRYDRSLDVPGVTIVLDASPREIASGDSTSLTLAFSNTSDRDVVMSFPERRQVGLLVYELDGPGVELDDPGDVPGTPLPIDVNTIAVPRRLHLRPFETWTYEVPWDGTLDLGHRHMPLDPGHYALVVGARRSGDDYVNRSRPIALEVTR